MLRSNDVSSSGAVLLEANPDSFYASAKQPHSAEERLAAYRARFTEETLLAKTAKELESFENEWNEFQTQSAAIEFKTLHQQQQLLHQGGPPLRIFSYEYLPQVPGKRKFIVTNLSSFWKKYS